MIFDLPFPTFSIKIFSFARQSPPMDEPDTGRTWRANQIRAAVEYGPPMSGERNTGRPERFLFRTARSFFHMKSGSPQYFRRRSIPAAFQAKNCCSSPSSSLVCHFPPVKSGTSTTAPPLATDISDRAVTAIQLAASYTSTGMDAPSLRQRKKV